MFSQPKAGDEEGRSRRNAQKRDLSLGAGTISRSYEIESWNYIRQKDYQLHFLEKADKQKNVRPPFPTTEFQRLIYFHCYTTTPFKIQITYLQPYRYGMFLWQYIGNVLLRNLPTNYIHMFLTGYNPNEYLFGSKMIPLCYGVSWQVVLCGILQLVASADILALFMYYMFTGVYHHDPWNRCAKTWNNVTPIPKIYRCYTVYEFRNITEQYKYYGAKAESRFTFQINTFKFYNNGTFFTVSPLHYFIQSWVKLNVLKYFSIEFAIIFSLIWILAALFYKQLYRKYIWKDWDFDFYAESISGPPIVHLLSSRSTDEVNPTRDSTIITLSNSIMYIFKGLVDYKLKDFVESDLKTAVLMSRLNPYPIFYMWTFFFSAVVGEIGSRTFFTMNFVLEFIIFMVTYQLLIEVLVCEWQWTRSIASILISITGLTLSITLEYRTKLLLYIFTTAITSLTEAVVICWLYPLHRLLDDIHFHKGTPVAQWRKWSFRMLPWYYVYKIYKSFQALIVRPHTGPVMTPYRQKMGVNDDFSAAKWAWAVGLLPLPVGALFAIFRHIIIQRKDWKKLLKPRADWGPLDNVPRQLRKQFDSREYVGSQSSRYLCRHLITKSQTPSYRLEVRYGEDDNPRHRSTIVHDKYRHEGDKKII